MFPKKSSFKEWINENNFSHENDLKGVQKIEGNEEFAIVTMKIKVFNKLNGSFFNGSKINFQHKK